MFFEKNKPDCNNDHRQQKHENGNAIDAMHIAHPFAVRCIRIFFFDIEVFCYLAPDSHRSLFTFQRYKTDGI